MKLIAIFLVLFPITPLAAISDKQYQDIWCMQNKGEFEVQLADQTIVYCMTKTHAIKFDFAPRAAFEGLGQALYYSAMTGKKPGIVVLLKSMNDEKHLIRLNFIIEKKNLDVKVWEIRDYSQ